MGNTPEIRYHRLRDRFYSTLKESDYGAVIVYAVLNNIAEANVQGDTRVRSALLAAGRRLLRDDRKLLVVVRNIGYEIARPEDHVVQARRQQGYARNRQRRALEITVRVPLEKLSEGDQTAVLKEQTRIRFKLILDKALDRAKTLPEHVSTVPKLSAADLLKHLTAKN